MAEIWLIRRADGSLWPSLEEDRERIKSIPLGYVFKATVTIPRNGNHNRKLRALLDYVFENQDQYEVKKHFISAVKVMCGHYSERITADGEIEFIPLSLSFDNMEQLEFHQFYETCIGVLLRKFVTTMTRTDLESAIEQILRFT